MRRDNPWDHWEPVEYVNEMGESRWQPRAGKERLWESEIRVFRGLWSKGTPRNARPKMVATSYRAARVGKRRYRKKAEERWTEVTEPKAEVGRMPTSGIEHWGDSDDSGSGWRQSDHGEEAS